MTLVAFEALAVATVMPEVKDDLGGLALRLGVQRLLPGSLLGIVVAGSSRTVAGSAPLHRGPRLFTLGLVVGGAATSMPMLVAGRICSRASAPAPCPPRPMPRWLVASHHRFGLEDVRGHVDRVGGPGAGRPAAALAIAHALSWRWVFLLLVPVTVVAGGLTVPALRGSMPPAARPSDLRPPGRCAARIDGTAFAWSPCWWSGWGGLRGGGRGSSGPQRAARERRARPLARVLAAPVAAAGHAAAGTPGVPATVAVRGMLTFAFFSADAYVPLAVIDGRGGPRWMAGAALTACTVLWTIGLVDPSPVARAGGPRLLGRVGFAVLAITVLAMFGVARGLPVWLAIPAWGFAASASGSPTRRCR
jgi:hypothetical protein